MQVYINITYCKYKITLPYTLLHLKVIKRKDSLLNTTTEFSKKINCIYMSFTNMTVKMQKITHCSEDKQHTIE